MLFRGKQFRLTYKVVMISFVFFHHIRTEDPSLSISTIDFHKVDIINKGRICWYIAVTYENQRRVSGFVWYLAQNFNAQHNVFHAKLAVPSRNYRSLHFKRRDQINLRYYYDIKELHDDQKALYYLILKVQNKGTNRTYLFGILNPPTATQNFKLKGIHVRPYNSII